MKNYKVLDMTTGMFLDAGEKLTWSTNGYIWNDLPSIGTYFSTAIDRKKGECVSPLWSVVEVGDDGNELDCGFSAVLIKLPEILS